MSLHVTFRGSIRNCRLIETFEDRIVELSLETNGFARIWRSASPQSPQRVVKGVLLELAPGLQAISLLISPEGVLLPVEHIARAESAPLPASPLPWISVQTGYAPLEAHVLLIELLDAMKKKFFPELEVRDDAFYWPTRSVERLAERRASVRVTPTAAEHAEDLRYAGDAPVSASRIKQLTELVQRTLRRPPEHPPVHFRDDPAENDYQRHGTEDEWDAFFKENERKQAGLTRAFEERSLKHDDAGACFEDALRAEGIVDLPKLDDPERPESFEAEGGEDVDETNWDQVMDEMAAAGDEPFAERHQHPLMARMTRLTTKILKLPRPDDASPAGFLDTMIKGVLEMSGGLAQVLSDVTDDDTPYGLKLVQLKRALRGASFARASLLPALESHSLRKSDCKLVLREIVAIEREIEQEVLRARRQLRRK